MSVSAGRRSRCFASTSTYLSARLISTFPWTRRGYWTDAWGSPRWCFCLLSSTVEAKAMQPERRGKPAAPPPQRELNPAHFFVFSKDHTHGRSTRHFAKNLGSPPIGAQSRPYFRPPRRAHGAVFGDHQSDRSRAQARLCARGNARPQKGAKPSQIDSRGRADEPGRSLVGPGLYLFAAAEDPRDFDRPGN